MLLWFVMGVDWLVVCICLDLLFCFGFGWFGGFCFVWLLRCFFGLVITVLGGLCRFSLRGGALGVGLVISLKLRRF